MYSRTRPHTAVSRLSKGELLILSAYLLIAALFFLPKLASAEINDRAGLFSRDAVASASRMIEEIQRSTSPSKDIVIETVPGLPSANVNVQATAEALFRERKINGILLFIVKDPHKLVVTVGKGTQSRFGGADQLRNIIIAEFKKGSYDAGLTGGISYLRSELPTLFPATDGVASARGRRSQAPIPQGNMSYENTAWNSQSAPAPSGGFGFGSLIIFGLIFMFIMRLFGGAGRGLGGFGGGRGGSFLTGLFGAFAGNWMYNRFFGGGMGNAWGSGYDHHPNSPMDSGGGFLSDNGDVGSSSMGSWGDGGSDSGNGGNDW